MDPLVVTTQEDFFDVSGRLAEGEEVPVVLKRSRIEYADGSLEAMRELYRQKDDETYSCAYSTGPIGSSLPDDLREMYREFNPNDLVVIAPFADIITSRARLSRFQLASLDNPLNFYLCKRLSVEELNLLHKEEQGLYLLARGGTPNGNG